MRKVLLIGLALFLVVTLLGVASFRWFYGDFFYLQKVHETAGPADRRRLIKITAKRYHEDKRNTAMSMLLGEALMRVGEAQLAVRVIHRQLVMHPADRGIRRAYADALAAKGERQKADRIFRQLLDAEEIEKAMSLKEPL